MVRRLVQLFLTLLLCRGVQARFSSASSSSSSSQGDDNASSSSSSFALLASSWDQQPPSIQATGGILEAFREWLRRVFGGGQAPTPPRSPTQAPTQAPSDAPVEPASWRLIDTDGLPTPRHEACLVWVQNKAYLLGGRKEPPVDEYDPATQTWVQVAQGPGFLVHHMQCVAIGSEIYIVAAWTGTYPRETNLDVVLVYDTVSHTWSNRTALPEARRRGSTAAVANEDETKIYVAFGNRGGHGNFATALTEFDVYHIDTDTWETDLPDAQYPRDHTGGALMSDGRFCVAGGRDSGGGREFFNLTVEPTECFDFDANEWQVEAEIPTPRAGSAYGTSCDGKLLVAGGEGFEQAFDTVEAFDGTRWETYPSLNLPRHGSGLAVNCNAGPCNNQIHIASGSTIQGANRDSETTTTETLFANGVNLPCA